MGIVLHVPFGKWEDRIVLHRDCYNCEICHDVVVYMGLDKNHHPCCQKCQDEFARGTGMSTKFRKMWEKSKNDKNNCKFCSKELHCYKHLCRVKHRLFFRNECT